MCCDVCFRCGYPLLSLFLDLVERSLVRINERLLIPRLKVSKILCQTRLNVTLCFNIRNPAQFLSALSGYIVFTHDHVLRLLLAPTVGVRLKTRFLQTRRPRNSRSSPTGVSFRARARHRPQPGHERPPLFFKAWDEGAYLCGNGGLVACLPSSSPRVPPPLRIFSYGYICLHLRAVIPVFSNIIDVPQAVQAVADIGVRRINDVRCRVPLASRYHALIYRKVCRSL